MSESSTNQPAGGDPFDVEEFARRTVQAYQYAEDDAEQQEERLIRLEEIVAARWPRRWFLRRQLAREIRASVAGYDDSFIPRRDFRGRRFQWASEHTTAVRRDRQAGDAEDLEDNLEPYCSACGAGIGIFIGHGQDWHHFRGSGTVESPVELFDADHEPAVAWREAQQPGGGFLA